MGDKDDEEAKVVFSGDIGNGNRPLIKDPQYIKDADYVVMESTYGDKEHETPPDYAVALAGVLKDTFTRGGNLVIPAFSVGRTQEMLYFIRRIKTEHLLKISRCLSIVRWQWRQLRSLIRTWRTVSARKRWILCIRELTQSVFQDCAWRSRVMNPR